MQKVTHQQREIQNERHTQNSDDKGMYNSYSLVSNSLTHTIVTAGIPSYKALAKRSGQ
jgi:hypothetical protein